MSSTDYIIMALACWRLSNLFANEDGPACIFARLREWVGVICNDGKCEADKGSLAAGLSCEWCNSVWVGAVLTIGLAIMGWSIVWLCLPLALSTVTIFLKYLLEVIRKVG